MEHTGTGALREPRPDFGIRADGSLEAGISPTALASRPVQRIPHAYDAQRFGSQQALAERLRRMQADGDRLVDLILRL
jgi:hypothetical protein